MSQIKTWEEAAREMVQKLSTDYRNHSMLAAPWHRAVHSMVQSWRIRLSQKSLPRKPRKLSRPSDWKTAIQKMCQSLRSRAKEQSTRDVDVLDQAPTESESPLRPQIQTLESLRNLRPGEAARLLNGTPLGRVISERQLYRYRKRMFPEAKHGERVDLLMLVGWLRHQRTYFESRVQLPRARKGTVTLNNVMKLLVEQNYQCALTGLGLTPESAALDHKLPVSRGGEHCIKNAQILHKDVNRAKGTMTNEEFIELCRAVVAHADRINNPRYGEENLNGS